MAPTPFASSFCNVETVCVYVSGLRMGECLIRARSLDGIRTLILELFGLMRGFYYLDA